MVYLVLLAAAILVFGVHSQAPTTHGPGHHGSTTARPHHHIKEPVELDNVYFQYDRMSHTLIARTKQYCYILALNKAEQHTVMTAAGLRSLEVRMFQMMEYAVHEAVMGQDLVHLSDFVGRICYNQTLVKIHD